MSRTAEITRRVSDAAELARRGHLSAVTGIDLARTAILDDLRGGVDPSGETVETVDSPRLLAPAIGDLDVLETDALKRNAFRCIDEANGFLVREKGMIARIAALNALDFLDRLAAKSYNLGAVIGQMEFEILERALAPALGGEAMKTVAVRIDELRRIVEAEQSEVGAHHGDDISRQIVNSIVTPYVRTQLKQDQLRLSPKVMLWALTQQFDPSISYLACRAIEKVSKPSLITMMTSGDLVSPLEELAYSAKLPVRGTARDALMRVEQLCKEIGAPPHAHPPYQRSDCARYDQTGGPDLSLPSSPAVNKGLFELAKKLREEQGAGPAEAIRAARQELDYDAIAQAVRKVDNRYQLPSWQNRVVCDIIGKAILEAFELVSERWEYERSQVGHARSGIVTFVHQVCGPGGALMDEPLDESLYQRRAVTFGKDQLLLDAVNCGRTLCLTWQPNYVHIITAMMADMASDAPIVSIHAQSIDDQALLDSLPDTLLSLKLAPQELWLSEVSYNSEIHFPRAGDDSNADVAKPLEEVVRQQPTAISKETLSELFNRSMVSITVDKIFGTNSELNDELNEFLTRALLRRRESLPEFRFKLDLSIVDNAHPPYPANRTELSDTVPLVIRAERERTNTQLDTERAIAMRYLRLPWRENLTSGTPVRVDKFLDSQLAEIDHRTRNPRRGFGGRLAVESNGHLYAFLEPDAYAEHLSFIKRAIRENRRFLQEALIELALGYST